MRSPKFSIVIPTRQINDYIREAIPYHLNQNFGDFEIIIVTEAKEKEIFPKTRIIRVGRVSPSQKRNVGVENSKGEVIAFIDDDAYPDKDWLKNADEEFRDKKVVALGGPGLVPKNATFFQKVSSEVYRLSSSKTGMRYGKAKGKEIEDWPTCNLFVRKKDFIGAGGFDTEYWIGEDVKLCYILKKNTGKKIVYRPDVSVYHYPRKNLSAHLKQTLFWGLWRGFLVKAYPEDSIRATYVIPALLVLWLFFGGIASVFSQWLGYLYALVFVMYLLFLFVKGFKSENLSLFFPIILVMYLSQIIYGVGFLWGLVSAQPTRATSNPAEKTKIKSQELNKDKA